MQPQHLPYLLNPGLCHVVLTYPETWPCMLDLTVGSFALRSGFLAQRRRLRRVPDGPTRFRPCFRLVLMQMSKMTLAGFTYRGLSPHKLTPMPGVHKGLQPTPQFVGSTRSGGENSIRPGFRGAAEPRCSVTEAKHGRIR